MRLERRRQSDCQVLLAILDDCQWHTLTEIQRAALEISGKTMTVHSRAAQLRSQGYVIHNESQPFSGDSRYRLIASPDELAEARSLPAASDACPGAAGSESARAASDAGGPIPSPEVGSPAPFTEASATPSSEPEQLRLTEAA